MRAHDQIITDGGGPAAVARLVEAQPGTVKQWRRAASIPAPYWRAFDVCGLATLEELAWAVAKQGCGQVVASDDGVNLPDHCDDGADNPSENVSRTSEPGSSRAEVAA